MCCWCRVKPTPRQERVCNAKCTECKKNTLFSRIHSHNTQTALYSICCATKSRRSQCRQHRKEFRRCGRLMADAPSHPDCVRQVLWHVHKNKMKMPNPTLESSGRARCPWPCMAATPRLLLNSHSMSHSFNCVNKNTLNNVCVSGLIWVDPLHIKEWGWFCFVLFWFNWKRCYSKCLVTKTK